MVPTVGLPPVMSFTVHSTDAGELPTSDAVNCCVRRAKIVNVAGFTARAPGTRKATADVAEPSGLVTVIGPVMAPAGTEVTMRFGAAALTSARTPLKETMSWAVLGLNP